MISALTSDEESVDNKCDRDEMETDSEVIDLEPVIAEVTGPGKGTGPWKDQGSSHGDHGVGKWKQRQLLHGQ